MRTAQAIKIFFGSCLIENACFSFSQFYDTAKTVQKAYTQADRALGTKQFYKRGRHN